MRQVSKSRWDIAQKFERFYQQKKARRLKGREVDFIANSMASAAGTAKMLSSHLKIDSSTQILEVGAGPHGTIYFLTEGSRFSLDPLARFYWNEFHALQAGSRVRIVTARGEQIPFLSSSFNLILSENVLDHTAFPEQTLSEIHRVLRPGGILLLAVNVENFLANISSTLHEKFVAPIQVWRAFGPHPFAFTRKQVLRMVSLYRFTILEENCSLESAIPQNNWISGTKIKFVRFLFRPKYLHLICRRG